jgi:CubicO group peptidase (beta-lactamase class C family)
MTDISDVDPASAGLSQAGIARLDAWNQALCSDERLPNSCTLIARNGHIGYCSFSGHQNPATASTAAKPISQDTIFRYYSMTKPIVSLALMMLHDDAAFQLNDPVKLYIPAFDRRKMRVLKEGSTVDKPETVPCETDITVKQLLTHTSGLSYGFDPTGKVNVVDGLYHRAGLGSGTVFLILLILILSVCPQLTTGLGLVQEGRLLRPGCQTS